MKTILSLLLAVTTTALAAPKVEETVLGPVNVGGLYTLTPAGGHAAYMGKRGEKLFMIVNGVEGPEFDEIIKSAGGGAFIPAKAGVWPGTLGGVEGHDAPVLFSRDGKHSAYAGRQGNEYVIIYDGKEFGRGPWELMGRRQLTMSPLGKYIWWTEAKLDQGRTIGRTFFHRKPTEWGAVVTPVISPDESRYAWAIPTGQFGKTAVFVDGKNAGYSGQQPVFTGDGSALLTISYDGGASVLVDGKPVIKGGVQVSKIVTAPAGKRYAAIVRQLVNNKPVDLLYIDGNLVPGSDHAQEAWFSPDGKRYAAMCKNPFGNHPAYLIIDGKRTSDYTAINPLAPVWTPDGARVIFSATDAGKSLTVAFDASGETAYTANASEIIVAGGRFAWTTVDHGRRAYTVAVDGKNVLPGGLYPTSKVTLSPDGSRYAFLTGPVGRNEVTGIVLDGQLQAGIVPAYFGLWSPKSVGTVQLAITAPEFMFSPDSKHVAFIGRTGTNPKSALWLDGKIVSHNIRAIFYPTFTPDNQHFVWVADEQTPGSPPVTVVYVDGQPVVRADGYFFRALPGSFHMDDTGIVTFLAADGDVVKRYRITPAADTSVATLLEKGTTVAAAPAPAPVAKTPAPAAPAAPAAAPVPPARPLTWADLVNHPERWPDTTKINVGLKFSSGALAAGSAVRIETVTPAGAQLIAPQGFVFNVKPEHCDLLEAANAQWAKFTPEQRDITPQKLAADPTLWSGKVKILEAGQFGSLKVPAGTDWPLTHVKSDELGIAHPQSKEMLMFAFNYTDIFARARDLALLPVEHRPGRMAASLEGVTIDNAGKPAAVPTANYYVFYFAASTCPRCKVFTPKLIDHYQKSLANRKDVAFVSWPTDVTTPPYLQYARDNAIPWPTLPVERKNLFANLGVFEIPGILVVDRFGNRLLATNQINGQPLEAANTTLAKLNDVLKP